MGEGMRDVISFLSDNGKVLQLNSLKPLKG
jgi:hypothetical protein